MRKIFNAGLLILILIFAVSVSSFAFNFPKAPSLGKKKTSSPSVDGSTAQQTKLIKDYMGAELKYTEANLLMAKAFDLKDELEALETEKEVLSQGNVMTKDEIKKHRVTSGAVRSKINTKMAEGAVLSAEGKAYYGKSLEKYFEGVIATKGLVDTAKSTLDGAKSVISNASFMEKSKLAKTFKEALYLAPKIPGDAKLALETGSKYVTYAKSNHVKVPKNATAALGDL